VTAWTQAEYDALRKAIASGALRVSYADRTVQYHSLAEMRSLLKDMERALGIETDDRFSRTSFDRG